MFDFQYFNNKKKCSVVVSQMFVNCDCLWKFPIVLAIYTPCVCVCQLHTASVRSRVFALTGDLGDNHSKGRFYATV